MDSNKLDIIIVGGGAAGLAAAIFSKRRLPERSIVILDGAKKLGAKILVAGGGRCNVTNVRFTPQDYCGGSRNAIKKVLRALPVDETIDFFKEIGVEMHEEAHGKLFPNSNKARTVLDALVNEAQRLRVEMRTDHRVDSITKHTDGFVVTAAGQELACRTVVLATGGKSLPKTGSDGFGYELARGLGHRLIDDTPSLVPLLTELGRFRQLSGIAQDVELTLKVEGAKPVRMTGALLWTHFGISGPVVLDISRHWHRAVLEKKSVSLTANLMPGYAFKDVEQWLIDAAATGGRQRIKTVLAERFPERLSEAVLAEAGIAADLIVGQVNKEARRTVVHLLTALPLGITGSRGYAYAEVTAGGVPLEEIDAATMQSRVCQGLFLVGEILDVDGRIGGYNFQWAWAGGKVVAEGLTRLFDAVDRE